MVEGWKRVGKGIIRESEEKRVRRESEEKRIGRGLHDGGRWSRLSKRKGPTKGMDGSRTGNMLQRRREKSSRSE